MNTKSMINQGFRSLIATGLAVMLVACGGSGGSDDDDSATSEKVVARGVITQLGSIYVNGVKYETPNGGSYSNDDSTSSIANFKVGQVVGLRGRRNDDGVTGTADEVEYEAEIEGEAQGGAITGITIVITGNTNASEIPGFSGALVNGTRYEVSGIWLDDTNIEATFLKIDDDGDDEDEIKGFVENAAPASFDVRGITYNYGGVPALSNGDFVEVHFDATSCTAPPNVTCTSTEVELEDDYNDQASGREVEFEGAVNLDPTDLAACPPGADFLIDMTCIDWNSVPTGGWMDGLVDSSDVVAGLRAEAEGHFNDAGLLIAEKIKGRGNRVRVISTAVNVDGGAGTFDLFFGDIQVTTMDGLTEYELDNLGTSVASISNTDELEVKGIRTGPTSMMALRIKNESASADEHKLRAVVDVNGADPSNNTVTVMGITSVAGSNTELELEDVEIAPGSGLTTEADIDAFLGMIDDDDIVNSSNGPRDSVEVQIDTTNGGDGSLGSPYAADEIEIEEEDD